MVILKPDGNDYEGYWTRTKPFLVSILVFVGMYDLLQFPPTHVSELPVSIISVFKLSQFCIALNGNRFTYSYLEVLRCQLEQHSY